MRRPTSSRWWIASAVLGAWFAQAPAGAQAPTAKGRTGIALDSITEAWTGDFDGMARRRLIRVLTGTGQDSRRRQPQGVVLAARLAGAQTWTGC